MEASQSASCIRSPLSTPLSPKRTTTRVPSPPRWSPPAQTTAPGSVAEIGGGQDTTGAETVDPVGAEPSAPNRDADSGAGLPDAEIERTRTPERTQNQQPPQRPPSPPLPPPQPEQRQQQTQQHAEQQQKHQKQHQAQQKQQPPNSPTQPQPKQRPPTQKSPQTQKSAPAAKTLVSAAGEAPAEKAKAPAKTTAPNPDRQMIVPPNRSTLAATSTGVQATNWGFAPLQTLSGQSLGSLEQHSMD